jgi:mono/diheme cytochrome c family protein
MRFLNVAILLVCGSACALLAAEPNRAPLSFDEARAAGRAKSRFLKEITPQTAATSAVPMANTDHFKKTIASVLTQKCVACHGPDSTMANLRVDQLNPDLLTGPDVDRWRGIYKVLSNGEMPPEDEPKYRLADAERSNIVDWLSTEMGKASNARRHRAEHSSFRRMTKYEYNYALQDLLGLPYPIANSMPPETASEDGFKNSSDLLQMSAQQFEAYRELGLKALERVTVRGERPQPVTYIISMQAEMAKPPVEKPNRNKKADDRPADRNRPHLLNRSTDEAIAYAGGDVAPQPGEFAGHNPAVSPVVAVLPRSSELKMNLDRFLPDEGMMRVRIRAGRTTMDPNEYASLRLIFSAHTSNNANFSQVVSQRDLPVTASADKPEFIEFDIPLSEIQRNPFRKLETTFPRRDEFLHIRNESNARGGKEPLRVVIDYIEVSAPHYDQWPPQSHREVFFTSKNQSDEQAYGREVLTRFLERAWRRPVTTTEVAPFLELLAKYRRDFDTFEGAMLEVLATALATPEFLYMTQRSSGEGAREGEAITDAELASRLSFFLWSSVPDKELLQLVRAGKLRDPAVLNAQVDRMLADPRSQRFSQHFVEQWLGLDGLEAVTHVKDVTLFESMRQESIAFFQQVLRDNASIMDFLHSDYVVVNERLAQQYGVSEVFGPHFRKVPIAAQRQRGGILTSAAMLTMNSDGTDSHPLKRGVWLLERILQDPPPPPPAAVPQVDLTDPRILQMTLKERIADHRNKPACNSCHSRIDPWGIAFENYDALGAFRMKIKDKPVDATAVLFNKQELAGADGLKRYLLTDRQDQFAGAMVHKMTAYALGRPLNFGDHVDLDGLTVQLRKQGDGLADLIHLVVNSNLFQSK